MRLTNPAIQQRVTAFTGAVDFLLLAGFQRDESGEGMEMPADKVRRRGPAAGAPPCLALVQSLTASGEPADKGGQPGAGSSHQPCRPAKGCLRVRGRPAPQPTRTSIAPLPSATCLALQSSFLPLCACTRLCAHSLTLVAACPQVDKAVLEVAGEQLNSALNNPFFGVL